MNKARILLHLSILRGAMVTLNLMLIKILSELDSLKNIVDNDEG